MEAIHDTTVQYEYSFGHITRKYIGSSLLIYLCLFSFQAFGQDSAADRNNVPAGVFIIRKQVKIATPRTLDSETDYRYKYINGPYGWYRRNCLINCGYGAQNVKGVVLGFQYFDKPLIEAGIMDVRSHRRIGRLPLPEYLDLGVEVNPIAGGMSMHVTALQPLIYNKAEVCDIFSVGARLGWYSIVGGASFNFMPMATMSIPKGYLSNFYLYYGYKMKLQQDKEGEAFTSSFNLGHTIGLVYRLPAIL